MSPAPPGPAVPIGDELSEEERIFWAEQIKGFADAFREARPWNPPLPPTAAQRAAAPAAILARRYMPAAEQRPEVALLMILAPWLLSVLRSELAHNREQREERRAAAAAAGEQRGDLRPQGIRENNPDPLFATTAILPQGVNR